MKKESTTAIKRGRSKRQDVHPDLRLLKQAHDFVKSINREDLALVSNRMENQEVKRGSKKRNLVHPQPLKRKGGGPPKDYTIIEMVIDLESELNRPFPNIKWVTTMVIFLKGAMNW